MAADGGTKAVVAALLANTGIAITKFVAFALTGISSMLAEAIHSVADAGNQCLLLLGGKQAKQEATPNAPVRLRPRALHLRVHRRRSCCSASAACSRSTRRTTSTTRSTRVTPRSPAGWEQWVPIVVLVIAIVLESFSFRTAIIETNKVRGDVVVRRSSSAARRARSCR